MTSNQEVFETVAKHLFAQGKQSMTVDADGEDGKLICAYRGENGCKCAVGVLIPDEQYRADMEGKHVRYLRAKYSRYASLPLTRYSDELIGMLAGLQVVHDDPQHWFDSADMHAALRRLADEYDLDNKFLDDLAFSDR